MNKSLSVGATAVGVLVEGKSERAPLLGRVIGSPGSAFPLKASDGRHTENVILAGGWVFVGHFIGNIKYYTDT